MTVSPAFVISYYSVAATAVLLSRNMDRLNSLISRMAEARPGTVKALHPAGKLPLKAATIALAAIALLVCIAAATMPDDNLHVGSLDVGEGDAILIQQGSCQLLVDGGPGTRAVALELGERMPFWDRTIELVVLTHHHQDHLAGLVEVLQRYEVRQVLQPALGDDSPLYERWLSLIEENDIESTTARTGQNITLGEGTSLRVLSPAPDYFLGGQYDPDNGSVVLHLSRGKVSFLLTGDIMADMERELIRRRACPATMVLKVAHHGSDTSTISEFLSVADPTAAIISCGEENRHGHPSEEVMDRLAARLDPKLIYRTDLHGTVEFTTDGERLWVAVGK
jgi:competence protein ComEC